MKCSQTKSSKKVKARSNKMKGTCNKNKWQCDLKVLYENFNKQMKECKGQFCIKQFH